jgi:FkbM family methyltransferase
MEFGAGWGPNTITRYLLQKLPGWQGLWLEPNPTAYAGLCAAAKKEQYPVELLNMAIGVTDGTIPFYPCRSCAAYSGTVPPAKRQYAKAVKAKYDAPIQVPQRRLETVLAGRQPGVMVMDAEERDTELVRAMMQSAVRPVIFMVEGVTAAERAQQAALLHPEYVLDPANI